MIDAAQANGVLLMEGFTQHFLPHLEYTREVIDSGEIGEVKIVRSELTYTLQDWENDVRANAELAGGSLLDAGCYCASTIRGVLHSEPLEVQAYQRIAEPNHVDATFVGVMRFPGDVMAYMATGIEQPFRGCCEVIGTKGRIEVPTLFGGDRVQVSIGGNERVVSFDPYDRFQLQIEHFSECILTGDPLLLPPEEGLRNVAVLAALKQAAEHGCSTAVEPV